MNLRSAARFSGVVLAAASVVALAKPAEAQKDGIERWLANIKVNASSKTILALFGNPNDIQIGDTAVRAPAAAGGGGQQSGGMMGGAMGGPVGGGMGGPMAGGDDAPGRGSSGMGGMMGGGSAPPMMGGMMGGGGKSGGPMMGGMSGGMMGGQGGSMMGGSRGGMMGGPMMGGQGGPMMGGGKGGMMGGGAGFGGDDTPGGGGGGAMMGGSRGGMMGGGRGGMMGGGGGFSGFGQTTSSSTPQEEVTWVYNTQARDAKGQKQAISYEFLISPEGKVSQIRVTGYVPKTKYDKSAKGITLGSTFKDLIGRYGSPKSVMKQGDLLVCSYPDQHIEFQLMNMRSVNGYADPYKGIFKVIAIQINAVE